jgi:hypothetical protein
MARTDTAVQQIHELMAELDRLMLTWQEPKLCDPDWRPESEEGKAIFARLAAAENREALRAWYAPFRDRGLNPAALNLKRSLERAVNESLD